MEGIAAVICNYNKKDDVIKCIRSVLDSAVTGLHLIVVDNASSDGSAEEIRRVYGNSVEMIVNPCNTGGSGGFNTGLKKALEDNFQYVMLLDNDVILDKYAIKAAVDFLENNPDVAVVGAKIFFQDNPQLVQEMGADIDFENYTIRPYYKNYTDDGFLPEVVYCDFIPACAGMIRMSALRQVGLMDETNFIYWDDIEWGYRFRQKGYKVVAYGKMRAWHKMGAAGGTSTFASYYFWRNRIRFFAKYCPNERLEGLCGQIIQELFQAVYSCRYLKKTNAMRTLMRAYDDGINGIGGIAGENRIFPKDSTEDRLGQIGKGIKNAGILFNGDYRTTRALIMKINHDGQKSITIFASEYEEEKIKSQFGMAATVKSADFSSTSFAETGTKGFDAVFSVCKHIFEVTEPDERLIYVDEYLNIIADERDREYCRGYSNAFGIFYETQYSMMVDKLKSNY